jgi:hypothetical protein
MLSPATIGRINRRSGSSGLHDNVTELNPSQARSTICGMATVAHFASLRWILRVSLMFVHPSCNCESAAHAQRRGLRTRAAAATLFGRPSGLSRDSWREACWERRIPWKGKRQTSFALAIKYTTQRKTGSDVRQHMTIQILR